MSSQEFTDLLRGEWPELSEQACIGISVFRDRVVAENAKQNLTRLTSPRDFFDGHVLDAKALLESGLVAFPAMDLGSGCGVPGLLAAIARPSPWVLVESEKRKAAFLRDAVEKLGLKSQVSVFDGRAESWLPGPGERKVESIVSRAVGTVSKIYTWLRPCSTWNNLVLLKGPRWEEEWAEFMQSRFRNELILDGRKDYSVGAEEKKRLIVRLKRVPRGTNSQTA